MRFLILSVTLLFLIKSIYCTHLNPAYQCTIRNKKTNEFLGILTLIQPNWYGIVPTQCLHNHLKPKDLYVILPNGKIHNVSKIFNNDCLGLTIFHLHHHLPQNDESVKHIVIDNETIFENGNKMYSYRYDPPGRVKDDYVELNEIGLRKLNIKRCYKSEEDEPHSNNCPNQRRPLVCSRGINTVNLEVETDFDRHCGSAVFRKTHSNVPYLFAIAYPIEMPVNDTSGQSYHLCVLADLQPAYTQNWINSITNTDF